MQTLAGRPPVLELTLEWLLEGEADTDRATCGTGWSGMMGQDHQNPRMRKVAGDLEGKRRCVPLHAEVPDAIVSTMVADGTLSLERRKQEREEDKLLVQTVTSETSLRSWSPCVTGRLTPENADT
ncbi:hypothetical protein NDU88_005160 [Pleurodeles waltl]|uniref:Uncharacterized protein n=1 Tax=Pleurodeles waltl TaxID=8319 RepID=A0AAV7WAP5_PLEWA|nr:hypothetical protein NDU88_005160 [Pleurodeles waltl]